MLERLVGMEYWSEVESHALSENVGYLPSIQTICQVIFEKIPRT